MTSMNLVNEQSGEKHIMTHERWKNTRRQDADEREPVVPEREPGNRPHSEPGNRPDGEPGAPDAETSPARKAGAVSDPDFRRPADEDTAMAAGARNSPMGNERLRPDLSPPERRVGVVSDPDR
jgi:hypothetical protein